MGLDYAKIFATFRKSSNEGQKQNECIETLIENIELLFPNKKEITVAELGCGRAEKAIALKEALGKKGITVKYTGYDTNKAMLAEAKEKMQDGTFIEQDIFSPVEAIKADIVLGIHSAYYGYERERAMKGDRSK